SLPQPWFGLRARPRRDSSARGNARRFHPASQRAAIRVHRGDGKPRLQAVLGRERLTAYRVRRTPRHETLRGRGLDTLLTRRAPPPSRTESPVLLLHGLNDTGDTFQFMVDAL